MASSLIIHKEYHGELQAMSAAMDILQYYNIVEYKLNIICIFANSLTLHFYILYNSFIDYS